MQNKETMSLVLSSDAKPRLKWTPQLHQQFIDAVTQLGGPNKATPKSLMRALGIHGLTLYHLKSHLQKYRLGKTQQLQDYHVNQQEDHRENHTSQLSGEISDGTSNQTNENMQIAQALQKQMDVQRKLQEQLEVQRHLQLRIEAQGKYLQSVLMKAHETLAGYNSSSPVGIEIAKAELSQLVSMVDSGYPSSLSVLTETGCSSIKCSDKTPLQAPGCSVESSLTSSASSERKEELNPILELDHTTKWYRNPSLLLPLMEIHPTGEKSISTSSQTTGRKRSGSTISDYNCVEQPPAGKRSAVHRGNTTNHDQPRNNEVLETFDLNNQYLNDPDSSAIDLNCKGVEEVNGSS